MHGNINMSLAWSHWHITNFRRKMKMNLTNRALGIEGDFDPDERWIGGALLHTRIAFAENKRGHYLRGKKSGKVNTRVLGKRAPVADPHLFKKKVLPGKKSYFVLLGVDISFSQVGVNIALTKACVMAQAELLHRAGIPFAVCAHTGNFHNPHDAREGMELDIFWIKEANEPWTEGVRERLRKTAPVSANIDGHTLEYYRKVLDRMQATDKIIMYYTDGKMPAENHDEELEILQREITTSNRKGYTLMGVGIRTDSPVRHGLDTVQVDSVTDTVKVVKHLEKRLLENA
jgi:cobalamin biosynthesis protein CobT